MIGEAACLLHHLDVELLIFTHSTTHHRAPDFPLFHADIAEYLTQYVITFFHSYNDAKYKVLASFIFSSGALV